MKTCHGTEAAFSLTAIRISVLRPDMGRIIFPTTDNFARTGALDGASRHATGRQRFYRKKSLPWLLISGIPRARAETTNLPGIGKCIAFDDIQRRCERAGAGAGHVGRRKSQRGDHKRFGASDHGKSPPGDWQKDEKTRESVRAQEH